MRNFFITTDSVSDITHEYMKKYNTIIIPQYYTFGTTVYGEELQMSPTEFYGRMKNGELPQSQANNPAVIEDKFRSVLDQGCDIIHISLSSAFSGSYNNVCMVARELSEEYPESRITVIDSLSASLGETLLLIQANELKNSGASYEEVVHALETFKEHINIQVTVNDLFHLQRGGRISKTTAFMGSALNMKPFLYLSRQGTLIANGTSRGRKKSLRQLIERMKESLEENTDYTIPVGIVHAICPEDAQYLANLVRTETAFQNIIINDINPSIGVHAGPGAIGLIYYGQKKPDEK